MAVILSELKCLAMLFLVFLTYGVVWSEGHIQPETESRVPNVVALIPNKEYMKDAHGAFTIYCFKNTPKSVFHIWRSVQLVMLHKPRNYEVFQGINKSDVMRNYQSQSIWQPSFIFSSSNSVIEFPAFSQYCVGISTGEKYSVQLQVRIINYWKVLLTVLGIFIFLSAPTLSRNTFFHYTTGISVGVFASLLILLYILSRFIPKKSISYAVLFFGSSFMLYILNMFGHHFNDFISQYMDYMICYCFVTSFLSFMVCYRLGPVKNERTYNIIQWSMQAAALLLVFFSSEYREVSTAVILLLLTMRIIPARWIKWGQFLWLRCFPPRVKLLTEVEFIEQGSVETKKALENLRQYCGSPECNAWKVIRKLKDPIRFSNFIETGSHYTDQELLDYNSEEFDDYVDLSDT